MSVTSPNWSIRVGTSLIGALAATPAFSQQPTPARPIYADSSVVWIMSKVKTTTGGVGLDILRQVHRSYAASKRNELADSITARIVSGGPNAESWLVELAAAGHRTGAGTPDTTVLGRLLYIERHAPTSRIHLSAIASIPAQVSPARAIPFLRDRILEPGGPMALVAVDALERIAFDPTTRRSLDGREALGALRDLVLKADRSPAQVRLCTIAASQHWPTPKICEGRA